MINPNRSPYHGRVAIIIAMSLPVLLLVLMFYGVLSLWQPYNGEALNWTIGKLFGCGLGALFHGTCWLAGSFAADTRVVKNRLKEFFSDLGVSLKVALEWYREDVKNNGLAYWIDVAITVINLVVFADALRDYIAVKGWPF